MKLFNVVSILTFVPTGYEARHGGAYADKLVLLPSLKHSSRLKRDTHLDTSLKHPTTQAYTVTVMQNSSKIPQSGNMSWSEKLNSTVSPQEESSGLVWWRELLDKSQLVMAVFGFFANLTTVITLVRNGKNFSIAILTLLRHQSVVDALACLSGALVLVQPFMWLPGIYVLDILVCYGWHGQGLYWNIVFISIWNLVVLAFERFLAVCHPFQHQELTSRKLLYILTGVYMCSVCATCGAYIQTHLVEGQCLPEYFIQGDSGKKFYYGFAISTFFTFYAIPCSMFITLYGMVILTFRRRSRSQLAASRVIDKATSELTKTAVVVTVIFIIAIGYDLWYYMLGYAGIVEYVVNSDIQKVGIWLSSFNSVANPFVYALLMPAYRNSVKRTFCGRCDKANQEGTSQASSETHVTTIQDK